MQSTRVTILLTALAAGCSPAAVAAVTDEFQLRGTFVVDRDFFVRGQLQPGETLAQFTKRYGKTNGPQSAWTRLDGSAIQSPVLLTSSEPLGLASGAAKVLDDVKDSFSCEGLPYGYYTDIGNECRVYHVCQPVAIPSAVRRASVRSVTLSASFFCNVGQVFDQRLLTCVSRTADFDCASQGYLYAASNSQFFRDVNFNMPPAAEDDNDGDGGDEDDGDDKGKAIIAEQLFSVHNGRLDKFGASFDKEDSEKEQVKFVDLLKRSFRQVAAVKVVMSAGGVDGSGKG